jgi:hypothetical protein
MFALKSRLRLRQRFVVSILLSIGLFGCGSLNNLKAVFSNASVTPIARLEQQKEGANVVYLQGLVGDRVPLLGSAAYQLKDQTGEVWVIAKKALPATGERVSLKGEIKYMPVEMGKEVSQDLYVVELERMKS